jgi:2-desacetyl-2-hydroxyethyl bacteriochlorophyllide A dehydrogenase
MIEKPVPVPQKDELLIKIAYAGICGSDIHIRHGKNPRVQYPIVMGHEFSGEIVKVGAEVTGWQVGDQVVANPLISCNICDACTRGHWHVCKKLGLTGIDVDGAFAEYVTIRSSQAMKVPEGVPLDIAALAEPLAVGVHAVDRGGVRLGNNVAILGGGTIGLMVALAAKIVGARRIIIIEVSDYRLSMIKQMGFTAIDAKNSNVRQEVLEYTGGNGADVVFEAAAAPATSAQMTGLLRIRGTAVMVGVHRQLVGIDMQDVNLRELTILGSRVYEAANFVTAVELLPSIVELGKVATHRLRLEEIDAAFAAAESGQDSLKVLLHP